MKSSSVSLNSSDLLLHFNKVRSQTASFIRSLSSAHIFKALALRVFHLGLTHVYVYSSLVAAPYWTNSPASQLYAPGETVKLDCQADGIPSPTITWAMNGIPLSGRCADSPANTNVILEQGVLNAVFHSLTEIDKDPRRTLTASGSLILKDIEFTDTAIFQCQASNKHGTILTNTNVYVIGECLFRT